MEEPTPLFAEYLASDDEVESLVPCFLRERREEYIVMFYFPEGTASAHAIGTLSSGKKKMTYQDLTMLSEEEEYTESTDEEEEYDERKVSQLRFLSGKKRKVGFEEVLNVSTEPPPPLSDYYGPRDFWQLTQPDGKGHLSTSVATTSARVGFKCRSILAKLREIYLRLIKVPHLKQKLEATNLMSVFDYKIRNEDNQVVLAMVERWWPNTHTFHLPCGELGITPRDFTMLTGIASKQEVKYIGGLFQLIEYHCYEYCQIGHHILIDNRLDDFYPRMLAWQTTRRKFMGNKAKYHLALMRQQLDLRTINNIQWDPFRNMKDALKREAQHLHDESRITHLTANLRRADGRLSQLNEYLDGQGIEVEWEDDEGEEGTSQARTCQTRTSHGRGSWGRGSRGRRSEGGAALPP
ncbi:hypothetical protein GIB67_019876 [Kingdonia uniflora]|uniref:Aminotransferase-like plant mobile domain-containing protein n=1 Tax=Kingdonia uniflora TaxID=39325 RepID=A0A7J7MKQ0_9MAGN|nr:hypothetical protein GIB67_019876 [Kingdonia uniflora]